MDAITELWLPILIAAVAIFFASFLAWMVLPHHKGDFKGLPDEDEFLARLKSSGTTPGQYMFPYCPDPSAFKDPQVKARYSAGPHGVVTVWPGAPNMGRNLVLTFIFYIVVGIFVAYLSKLALAPGEPFMVVFRFTGAAAVTAYALGVIPGAVWFGKTLRSLIMDLLDNIVYGIITGLIFAWLWPEAETLLPIG